MATEIHSRKLFVIILAISSVAESNVFSRSLGCRINYPDTYRDASVVDDFNRTSVSDPYRWMEDVETPANVARIKKFVDDQNKITVPYVEKYHFRDKLRSQMSELWNYRKCNEMMKHGNHYFQFSNTGLENQNVLYIQDSLQEPTNRRVFLDPNDLSEDGTIALTTARAFSKNGEIFAYGLSESGSDWITIHFRNVSSGQDLEDTLVKVKFTDIVWKGNEGIFYGHYPEFGGDSVRSDPETDSNQAISYHKIGTAQTDDTVVFTSPGNPNRIIASGMAMGKDEKVLIITPEAADGEGSYGDQSIYVVTIEDENPEEWAYFDIVTNYDAKYKYITNDNEYFYFLTNKNASKNHVVKMNFNVPDSNWTIIVPEDTNNVINWAAPINENYLVVNYLEDVKSKLELRRLDGSLVKNLTIDMGSIQSYSGGRNDQQLFIKFVSFLVPNRIYLLDFSKANESEIELEIFDDVTIPGFNPDDFIAYQRLYPSVDNTPIPMFIVHHKDLVTNKENPAMIYGYGGFDINVLPEFAVQRIVFMQNFGGVVAITNLRGGGEFGIEWHQGGSLKNKQNVFDDFQSAAAYLNHNNYTKSEKIIIEGRSNGGLLVGACVNQRPGLFGAAIATVGVMDMLRYHRFTIGKSWISEYGNPDYEEYFPVIYKYSPLHNIKMPGENVQYPAVLVTTSDHDDRVVPAHSYKYTAELQYSVGKSERQTNPLMLRVETEAGHGAGKPTSKQIEEQVDIFSFIGLSLNLTYDGEYAPPPLPCSGNRVRHNNISFSLVSVILVSVTSLIVKL